MLQLSNVIKSFGGLHAVDGVDLEIAAGPIVGIIGRNGAGKTTLFNLIAGRHLPTSGEIRFEGRTITRARAYARARMGIGRTFQIPEPLLRLSVFENVLAGAFINTGSREEASELALDALTRCDLLAKAESPSGELGVADLKRLEVARAVATGPRLLLLDEVMAGLRPVEVEAAMDLCRSLKSMGLTLIVVEHVMHAVMNLCERVVVVDQGRILADAPPAEIQKNDQVVDIYLGRAQHA